MGCDIHIRVEQMDANGQWLEKESDLSHKCWNCDGSGKNSPQRSTRPVCTWCDGTGKHKIQCWYDGRNYTLFALLAGVRNKYNVTPLSEPRGIPDDAGWKDEGWHTYSWLTVEELMSAKWDEPITLNGYVNLTVYKNFRDNGGDPYPSSQSVVGRSAKIVSNEEMDAILAKNKHFEDDPKLTHYYTKIKWKETLKAQCSWFYENTLPALQKLRNEGRPVRMLFCFDS